MAKKKRMRKGRAQRSPLPEQTDMQKPAETADSFTGALFDDEPEVFEEIPDDDQADEQLEISFAEVPLEEEKTAAEEAEPEAEEEVQPVSENAKSAVDAFREKHEIHYEDDPHWIHDKIEDPTYFSGYRYSRSCRCSVCGHEVNMEKPVCPSCGTKMY